MSKGILLMIVLLSIGCSTTAELRKLSVGMDKKEVISILGEPITTRATTRDDSTIEIWDYKFAHSIIGFPPGRDTYWIFFKESKLFQWGEEGDWGISTKSPDRIEKVIIEEQTGNKAPKF
jgi:hypothetical protein